MTALARQAATAAKRAYLEESVMLPADDLARFENGGAENARFWERLGGRPSFEGRSVLDVGSGWGRMATDLGYAGAKRVLGLDIKQELVDFSNANVRLHHPRLAGRVEFRHRDLRDLDERTRFDVIVSKDSFEHILDLEGMLEAMKRRLKPGGRIYAGWGPLYPSPYGDHDRREVAFAGLGRVGRVIAAIPWGHLPLESVVVSLHDERQGKRVSSLRDLGLNGLSISQYRRLIFGSGLVIADLRVNQSASRLSHLLSLLAKLPALEDYCVHNVYCVLENR